MLEHFTASQIVMLTEVSKIKHILYKNRNGTQHGYDETLGFDIHYVQQCR